MSLKVFQFLDNGSNDNSILKRDFLKIYHQQAANLFDSDQNLEFLFEEKKITTIKLVMHIVNIN